MPMTEVSRDRLRELLDAVLADEVDDRTAMARRAYASPYHFSRLVRRGTGESPVALQRRVILERAAWRLRNGESVTEVALGEGYDGADFPARGGRDLATLVRRHEAVAPRWIDTVQRIADEGRWADVLIDALCDPPESFALGSVVSHVLTYSAYRRQLVRRLLRDLGGAVDNGDPNMWLRERRQPGHHERGDR